MAPDTFDLDRYLDVLAPHLMEAFRRHIPGKALYEVSTTRQVHPVPVTLRAFLAGLTRFRARVRVLDSNQRRLLDHRVAQLCPESNVPTLGFALTVLPAPVPDAGGHEKEANSV